MMRCACYSSARFAGAVGRHALSSSRPQQRAFLPSSRRAPDLAGRRHIISSVFAPGATKTREQQQGATTFDTKDTTGVTETVWDQHLIKKRYPPLDKGMHAEVVVVGGGIAGASAAYMLQKAGKQVVLLEKRVRSAGQTGRTTAHLMPWNDDYYWCLEKEMGKEKVRIVADSHIRSIDMVEQIVKENNIDCNFQRVDGYLFPYQGTNEDWKRLDYEYQACQRLGGYLSDVEWVDLPGDAKWGGIKRALKFPGAADFQPVHYVDGLLEAFSKLGGVVHEDTSVKWQGGGELTANGHTVTADHVVLATNSPIHRNLAVHARQSAHRSYVVGLKIAKDKVAKADFWSTNTPYHYVRTEDKGDHYILVVGGMDHDVGQNPKNYMDFYKSLEEFARVRWTDAEEVVYRWSGMVYEPSDKLGMYGLDPLDSSGNVYVITGDSGQGMTGGTIGGSVVTDLICGRANPWIDVYTPNRLPNLAYDLMGVMEEGAQNIKGFSGIVLPKIELTSQLQPGEGCVTQNGLTKAAVYKDEDGKINAYSALCPHLGCLVEWNPKEKTFDCPCHGSHFDREGKCVQGPAISDLEPVEFNA